jgi:hypothetical protein
MLLTAADGGVHSHTDFRRWMETEGFTAVTVQPFPPPMPHWVLTGTRT